MEWTAEPPVEENAGGEAVTITSPLSDIVISAYDPKTGKTRRRVCPKCRRFIETDQLVRRGDPYFDAGVGDPIYFIGAGVKYRSLVVPIHGRVAFHDWENWVEYRDNHPKDDSRTRFSYHQKKNWKDETGVPFPYEFFD
jgi:hypothetical protein